MEDTKDTAMEHIGIGEIEIKRNGIHRFSKKEHFGADVVPLSL
jgi:hypothetical protein